MELLLALALASSQARSQVLPIGPDPAARVLLADPEVRSEVDGLIRARFSDPENRVFDLELSSLGSDALDAPTPAKRLAARLILEDLVQPEPNALLTAYPTVRAARAWVRRKRSNVGRWPWVLEKALSSEPPPPMSEPSRASQEEILTRLETGLLAAFGQDLKPDTGAFVEEAARRLRSEPSAKLEDIAGEALQAAHRLPAGSAAAAADSAARDEAPWTVSDEKGSRLFKLDGKTHLLKDGVLTRLALGGKPKVLQLPVDERGLGSPNALARSGPKTELWAGTKAGLFSRSSSGEWASRLPLPTNAVAIVGGLAHAGTDDGLYYQDKEGWKREKALGRKPIRHLWTIGGRTFAATDESLFEGRWVEDKPVGFWRRPRPGIIWTREPMLKAAVRHVSHFGGFGRARAATDKGVFLREESDGSWGLLMSGDFQRVMSMSAGDYAVRTDGVVMKWIGTDWKPVLYDEFVREIAEFKGLTFFLGDKVRAFGLRLPSGWRSAFLNAIARFEDQREPEPKSEPRMEDGKIIGATGRQIFGAE